MTRIPALERDSARRTPRPVARPRALIVTCEHGGCRIPRPLRHLFAQAGAVIASHRGWDRGALPLARGFARRCQAPLYHSTVSRLVVELNRSPHHPQLFSPWTRKLSPVEKSEILAAHYHPHRQTVEAWIAAAVARGERVLHLSVHTFTPELNGQSRRADVGWLYDPARDAERTLVDVWRGHVATEAKGLRLRRNYPYRGIADGFTTHLRRRFGDQEYAGIELEVSQRFPQQEAALWRRLQRVLPETLSAAIQSR